MPDAVNSTRASGLAKAPTGIPGLDDITSGGLPRGRATLICGSAGSGKTLLAVTFLVNGAERYDEPGVLMTFEEHGDEVSQEVASLGMDVQGLVDRGKLALDYVHIERSEIEETGEYDLEGLFVRLDHAIRTVNARRVVLDTIEALFGGLANETILRAELRRLFRWLKERGVTAVITAERGDGALTRQGLEEYVSDAVILLDHRVDEQVSTRRLRVVKYRGSHHGTNEYPFLIDQDGITVVPITSLGLSHDVSRERVSTGVGQLDELLGGGYFRGTTVFVSGEAGSGKTSLAAHFAEAACRRGGRVLSFLFEESPAQLRRNMESIGIDLGAGIDSGRLIFYADRPSGSGLEAHLARIYQAVRTHRPAAVLIDPVTNLLHVNSERDVRSMLTRIIDHLKTAGITSLFTSVTASDRPGESGSAISSLMDTWIYVGSEEIGRTRHRQLRILKSRGMSHSTSVHEFAFTESGLRLIDAPAPDPARERSLP